MTVRSDCIFWRLYARVYPRRSRREFHQQIPRRARRREVCAWAQRVPAGPFVVEGEEADHPVARRAHQRSDQVSGRSAAPAGVTAGVRPYAHRRIVLGVTGGIASYKSAWLPPPPGPTGGGGRGA